MTIKELKQALDDLELPEDTDVRINEGERNALHIDEVCKDETYRDGKWVPIAELLIY